MRIRALLTGKSENSGVHLTRAVLSSSLGFAVDFGILVVLVELAAVHYIVAATIGFTAGTTITYLLSIFWIFPRRSMKSRSIEYSTFVAVGVVGVLLNDGLLYLFTETAGLYYMVSRICSASAVFFWNFFARKRLLFSKKKERAKPVPSDVSWGRKPRT